MFKKRSKIETVPGIEYTDFSEQFKGDEKYATLRQTALLSAIPVGAALIGGLTLYNKMEQLQAMAATQASAQAQPVTETIEQIPAMSGAIAQSPEWAAPATQPVGYIADKSLEVLAAALDPVIQILVAISFPIASVIMVGACFFFMLGNSEKAWGMIMNAGLGYVLIQLSPLFLDILKTVGSAV